MEIKKFPTKHPYVKNKDGSTSNVLLGGFEIDGKHYVIPTMVEGKKLSDAAAVRLAESFGLENYPTFDTQEEADEYAKRIHGAVGEDGAINTPMNMDSLSSLLGTLQLLGTQ